MDLWLYCISGIKSITLSVIRIVSLLHFANDRDYYDDDNYSSCSWYTELA